MENDKILMQLKRGRGQELGKKRKTVLRPKSSSSKNREEAGCNIILVTYLFGV